MRIRRIIAIILAAGVLSAMANAAPTHQPQIRVVPDSLASKLKTVLTELSSEPTVKIDSAAVRRDLVNLTDDEEYDNPLLHLTLNNWRTLDYDSILLQPDFMFMPLIFEQQRECRDTLAIDVPNADKYSLNTDRAWLDDALARKERTREIRYQAMTTNPQLVKYNMNSLPEPPKKFVIVTDPTRNMLTVKEMKETAPTVQTTQDKIKYKNWIHTFTASLQFSQTYLSSNWYQGGNNNINALGDLKWIVELNQTLHPKYLFSNTIQYRAGINSTPSDTIRSYNLSEDLFQWNTTLGIKAVKNWYYSASMDFKTQFFNNYGTNSTVRQSSFLSSGELNLGIGMTFNYKSKDNWKVLSLSISPLSYNLKTCIDDLVDETRFGIEAGKHTRHNVGSKMELKFSCKFNESISWSTRLYVFSDYKFLQGDWENTIDFSVTRHLTARIFAHLRYDSSRPKDDKWKYWQLKEMLSIGLTWRFATI